MSRPRWKVETNLLSTPLVTADPNLHQRVAAIFAAALEEAYKLIEASKFDGITKRLIVGLVKTASLRFDKLLAEMDDAKILEQIYFVRDEIIPFLLGSQE
jgi:hypothetical protein